MLQIEAENPKMKNYLEIFEKHLRNGLCRDMNLSELNLIKTVDRNMLPKNVDARNIGDTIFLSFQSIEEAMKTVNLSMVATYLNRSIEDMNCEVKNLLNNLYHEFCHINERSILPSIHNIINDDNNKYNLLEKLVAHFWIEFVVECKSGEQHFRSETELCDSFATANWDIKYIKGNRDDINDLYWLMYSTPYFISLCFINHCFENYCSKITDKKIATLVQKLYIVCTNLYKEGPFDNYEKIKVIGDIYESTFNTKSRRFAELYL